MNAIRITTPSLIRFIKIDPDMIKGELPELSGYMRSDPESAATKVHRESTMMSDVLFEHALMDSLPMLVDGSLRDVEWYRGLFRRIRNEYPKYRIAIVHVNASRDTIYQRADSRAELTGRVVPRELLDMSIEQVHPCPTAPVPPRPLPLSKLLLERLTASRARVPQGGFSLAKLGGTLSVHSRQRHPLSIETVSYQQHPTEFTERDLYIKKVVSSIAEVTFFLLTMHGWPNAGHS